MLNFTSNVFESVISLFYQLVVEVLNIVLCDS